MSSNFAPVSTSIDPSIGSSAEIKQEEPAIKPLAPLVTVSGLTPVSITAPTFVTNTSTVSTPSTTPAAIITCTPIPPTSAPISISTLIVSSNGNRKQGRQGRVPKERTLTKKQPAETVNYPCHEQLHLSEFHQQKLQELNVYPTDGVSSYTRSIPFKGAKEGFLKKTGRSRFDVFEYRFTAPNIKGESRNWWVMWDYYNGLVRVHDFFDCCKPGKTEPGNAVKEKINPGLQDVCHNITGGNLHAQGYWIPFLAAKALAAKFCFRIRYALTIIFGDDFPTQCLQESHPDFGKYQISPEIIRSCQEKAARQYIIETQRVTPAPQPPSTPLSYSSSVTSVATSSSKSSEMKQSGGFKSPKRQRITPERTAANRYFDPIRGGYTNGSSGSRTQSSQSPRAKMMKKRTERFCRTPSEVSSTAPEDSSTESLGSTPQSGTELIHLPPMGYFSPVYSTITHRHLQPVKSRIRRPTTGKIRIQPGVGSRQHPETRRPSNSPAVDSSSGTETYNEHTRKKQKITLSEPRMYTNSYMNPVKLCIGTFTSSQHASRDPTIPQPSNPYTRKKYNELVALQVEESPEDLLAVEAAGQLMELQRREYDKNFAQGMKLASSALKRRRSN